MDPEGENSFFAEQYTNTNQELKCINHASDFCARTVECTNAHDTAVNPYEACTFIKKHWFAENNGF